MITSALHLVKRLWMNICPSLNFSSSKQQGKPRLLIFHISPTCPAPRTLQSCPSPSVTGRTAKYLGWVTFVFTSHVCMPVSCFQMQKLFLVGTYRTMLPSPVRPEADWDWKSKYRSLYWSSNKLLIQVLLCIPGSWGTYSPPASWWLQALGSTPYPYPHM